MQPVEEWRHIFIHTRIVERERERERDLVKRNEFENLVNPVVLLRRVLYLSLKGKLGACRTRARAAFYQFYFIQINVCSFSSS